MAAVNVTFASVISENTNLTVDPLNAGVKNSQESATDAFSLPVNGGPTPSGPLTATASNIAATAYGIPNEPYAANQQQQLATTTGTAIVNAHAPCAPGLQQPYNHLIGTDATARTISTATGNASNLNTLSTVPSFVADHSSSSATSLTDESASSVPIPSTVLTNVSLTAGIRPFVSAAASVVGVTATSATRPATQSNSLHNLVAAAPRVRIGPPASIGGQVAQLNSGLSSASNNFRTLAPRIVVNSPMPTTILRVQQPPSATQANQQNMVLPLRTTQAQLVNRAGGITLPGGLPLTQNVFFVKNEQTGQVMMVQGQPPLLPAGQANQVMHPSIRLQPTSSVASVRPASTNLPSGGIVGVIGSPSSGLRVQTPLGGRLAMPLQQSTGVQLMASHQQHQPSMVYSQNAIASRAVQQLSSASVSAVATNGLTPTASTTPTPGSVASKDMLDNVRKCKNFLSTLLKLASNQPPATVQNVKNLIQGLVDGNVEPEDFTSRLQKELKSSPQPYLVPFLKKSLPLLRHSLSLNKMHIDGVRPPPPTLTVLTPATISPSTVGTPLMPSNVPVVGQHVSMAMHPVVSGMLRPATNSSHQTLPITAGLPGRTLVPNFNSLTLQQRQALIAAQQQQQRILAESNRQLLTRPASISVAGSTPGLSVAMPRVAFNSNGPTVITPSSFRGMLPRATLAGLSSTATSGSSAPVSHKAEKRKYDSLRDDDDINDVAAMGGVNLVEESRNILAANAELVLGQLRSCKDESFLDNQRLHARITDIARRQGVSGTLTPDVVRLVSHATQERLRTLLEKLSVVAEHRGEVYKNDGRYEVTSDVKSQMKFLAELDSLERKRHEEVERGVLMRAAKSRAKLEDPEQLKLKEKAKAMQQAEMEEVRQREANMTALAAIGPRRQRRPETATSSATASSEASFVDSASVIRPSNPVTLRPRIKRVCIKDLVFVLEQEQETRHSPLIYKALLK